MTGRAVMIQGTGSDVGKSVIVAGLCRLARRRGLSVAPFKPQNMSNNAAACEGGGEIGRAQALQARAAGLAPHTDFNPVLLKPETDRRSQVVVHGRPVASEEAAAYMAGRYGLMPEVMGSFNRLIEAYDLVVVEGAGSPAEVNLRDCDIANMGFARKAGVPVCLLGDIDRGGVIAALVGTKAVLDPADADFITGFAVNKFRGDPALFTDGISAIEDKTGWPSFGIIPWLAAAGRLPQEDAVSLVPHTDGIGERVRIAAPMLSRIANFDDADPLRLEPNVDFSFVPPGRAISRDVDVVILFGTKSTLGDLAFLRDQGWDHDIIAHARAGGHVLGICGGLQMLGRRIIDTEGRDGPVGKADGLGLLDLETSMTGEKTATPVSGRCALTRAPIHGYEIHVGETSGADLRRPMVELERGPDGARSLDGRIEGTYVHGLFASDTFRAQWLGRVKRQAVSSLQYESTVDGALDELADGIEAALDIDALFAAARSPGWRPRLR